MQRLDRDGRRLLAGHPHLSDIEDRFVCQACGKRGAMYGRAFPTLAWAPDEICRRPSLLFRLLPTGCRGKDQQASAAGSAEQGNRKLLSEQVGALSARFETNAQASATSPQPAKKRGQQ
jgi:hypothetical protein